MQTNITLNLSLFLNLLLRRFRVLPIVLFIFLFNLLHAQTTSSGLENIVLENGAVIYIDSIGLPSNSEEVALNKRKEAKNLAANNRKKLAIDSQSNKKAKSQTKQDLPEKIEYTYHSKESDSSFSTASKQQIIALNSNTQWNAVGVIEEAKYQFLHALWNKSTISEKEIFFAEHTISYKSYRAPPFC